MSHSLVTKTQDCTPEKQIRSIICSTYTSHILESPNSWFLQLFDLLLDHKLKGLVVDEPWQFSSTVSLLILLHFFFKPLVNCNRQTILCFRVPLLDSCGPIKENDYGGHVHLSPERSSWLSHFQNCLLRSVKMLSLSPHLSSSPTVRLMTSWVKAVTLCDKHFLTVMSQNRARWMLLQREGTHIHEKDESLCLVRRRSIAVFLQLCTRLLQFFLNLLFQSRQGFLGKTAKHTVASVQTRVRQIYDWVEVIPEEFTSMWCTSSSVSFSASLGTVAWPSLKRVLQQKQKLWGRSSFHESPLILGNCQRGPTWWYDHIFC